MNTTRLLLVIFIILLSPEIGWSQNALENLPSIEPSSTIVKPSIFHKVSTYLIVISLGAIVFASGVWYNIYQRKHQHPYLFLEEAELEAKQAEEEGKIEKAIEILNGALQTIENDPGRFSQKSKSRKETIWFLKRKLQELNDLMMEDKE